MSKTERDKKIVDMYNNGYSIRDIWKESGVKVKAPCTAFSINTRFSLTEHRDECRASGNRTYKSIWILKINRLLA